MAYLDRTSIGGVTGGFQTTRWSLIQAAKTDDQTRRHLVVGNLMTTYWRPVYCYLRKHGYDNETAKDLTQGFFCEIIFGRGLVDKADQAKGRFRTFLLTALERYVISVRRRQTRRKAMPKGGFVELAPEAWTDLQVPDAASTAEQAFHFRWAADLLDQVLSELQEEYGGTGRSIYWDLFQRRVLSPIFEGVESPPLAEICARLGIENVSVASNMIATVKRRFRTVLTRRLRDLVESDSEAEEELNDMFKILSKPVQEAGPSGE